MENEFYLNIGLGVILIIIYYIYNHFKTKCVHQYEIIDTKPLLHVEGPAFGEEYAKKYTLQCNKCGNIETKIK